MGFALCVAIRQKQNAHPQGHYNIWTAIDQVRMLKGSTKFYKTASHFMKTAGSFLEEKTRTGGSLIPKFSKKLELEVVKKNQNNSPTPVSIYTRQGGTVGSAIVCNTLLGVGLLNLPASGR